jgi:predicted TIM-barrel fold metal-dependent hydrolase
MVLAKRCRRLRVPAPRRGQEILGRVLQAVGAEKILWGSEAALAGGLALSLQAFLELEIPAARRSGYGYSQITLEDKRKILGENFAKVMGIDLEAKKREPTAHPVTKRWEPAA